MSNYFRRSVRGKTILLTVFVSLFVVQGTASYTNVTTPDTDSFFGRSTDIQVDWSSSQDHASSAELMNSTITVDDGSNTVEKVVTRGTVVNQNKEVTDSYILTDTELSALDNGTWEIDVVDWWNESLDLGGHTTADGVNIEGGAAGTVATVIKSPDSGTIYDRDSSLDVEWNATNDYNIGQDLVETNFVFEDGAGNTVTHTESINTLVAEGGTESNSVSFAASEFDSLGGGTWTLDVTDTWEYDESDDSVSFDVETSASGSVSLSIDSPTSTDEHTIGNDLTLDWTSTNDYNVEQTLQDADVRVEDEAGRSHTETVEIGTSVASDDSTTNSVTIVSENLSDLDFGTWTVKVTDTWENAETTTSVSFDVVDTKATFGISTESPSSDEELLLDPNSLELTVEFTVQNDGTAQKVQNDLELSDSNGNRVTATKDTDFTAEEQRTLSYTFSHNQLEQLSLPSSWTFSVDSSGVDSGAQDTTSVTVQVEEIQDIDVLIAITNIQQDDTITLKDDNRELKPNLGITNIGASAAIDVSLELTDGTETVTKSFDSSFNQDEDKDFIQTFAHSDLQDFTMNTDWTLTATAEKNPTDTEEITFYVESTSNENQTTNFDNNTSDDTNTDNETDNTTTNQVQVNVDTDIEQGISPDNREFTVSYKITNTNRSQSHDITLSISDGTLTAEKTVTRDFQADETRSLSETFSHETLKALDMEETWEISVSTSGVESGSDDDVQTMNPQQAQQTDEGSNNNDERTITGSNNEGLPRLPALVVVLFILVAGIVYIYRQQ